MSSPIQVLMTSTSYPLSSTDWRGLFIKQMLMSLSEQPQLALSFWGPPGDVPKNVEYVCEQKESIWLKDLMDRGGIAHLLRNGGFDRFTTVFKLLLSLRSVYRRQNNVEIHHINWLQNALPLWGTKTPTLVTVLGSDFGILKLPGMVFLLRQVFKQRSCVLTPNADWMEKPLKKYFNDVAEVVTIPLGIDEEWYNIKRTYAPSKQCKWLVVSRLTKKKIGFLFDWGEHYFQKNCGQELHLFGPMQENLKIPSWVHYHGSTHAAELREHWFPQAAGLITLSQHDEGRPQVMLEAMASGLPILASRLPAHDNFIKHIETGWLAASENEFQKGLEWLSKLANNRFISSEAKMWVHKEVGTWQDCAKRYIIEYNKLLTND